MHASKLVAAVFLALLLLSSIGLTIATAAQNLSVSIKPSDDAFVVADLNDPNDTLGWRSLNTANSRNLSVWYAWNYTITNSSGATKNYPVKVVSILFMKFNFTSLLKPESVASASLNLYQIQSQLGGVSRYLVAYEVPNNNWTQKSLNWYTAPAFNSRENSSTSIANGETGWYSFPLTAMVQNATRPGASEFLSIAIGFPVLYQHSIERVLFNSTRAGSGAPYIQVNYVGTPPGLLGYDSPQAFMTSPVGLGALALAVAVVAGGFYFLGRRRTGGGSRRKRSSTRAGQQKAEG